MIFGDDIPGNVSPDDLNALMDSLARTAIQNKVRLRLSLEVEPRVDGQTYPTQKPQPPAGHPLMTPEQYIAMLDSATYELRNLQAAVANTPSGSEVSASIAAAAQTKLDLVAETTGFWQADNLFVDHKQSIRTDDGTVEEALEIPAEYIAIGSANPAMLDHVLLAELDFIDAQIPEPSATSDITAASVSASLKALIRRIKKLLKSLVEPKIETAVTSLSSFQDNWRQALTAVGDKSIAGVNDSLSALLPQINWTEVGTWLTRIGPKIPKPIQQLSLVLRQLIRWLFGWFERVFNVINKKFNLDVDWGGQISKTLLKELPEKGIQLAINALWQKDSLAQSIEGEITRTRARLVSSRLSSRQRRVLESSLLACENTVQDAAWTLFAIGKVAQVAGWVFTYLAPLEPGPILEIAFFAMIVADLILVVVLGSDALRDDSPIDFYQGIGPLAINGLNNL